MASIDGVISMVERKAFAWNWIINGLIIGLIVLVVFASILSKVYVEEARQSANREFNEVYSRVNALCSANAGEEMFYNINVPDLVELFYVSPDNKVLPTDIESKKKGYGTAVASNMCMKLREEQIKCRSLKCKAQMSFIGQKKTVMSLADSILSKPKYVVYPLFFEKEDCGVAVLKDGKCTPNGCEAGLAGVCSMPVAPWWDATRRFRFPVVVEALGFERFDKPAEVKVDFTQLLSALGQSGSLVDNSIRVVESDADGTLVSDTVQFQFDKDSDFNALTKASGNIVFIASGTTQSTGIRYYNIYFDVLQTPAVTYTPLTVTTLVQSPVSGNDGGGAAFGIATSKGTYYLQKNNGGLSSINDLSGNDWLNHQYVNGNTNQDFRGFPNSGHPQGYFHPGFNLGSCSILSQGPIKASIRFLSTDGFWEGIWDFYPQYATITFLKVGHPYWVLYEGTPGGVLEKITDFMYKSDGTKYLLGDIWNGDLTANEWVYFTDPNVGAGGRSLFVAQREDDAQPEEYWQKDGELTVFGFGRVGLTKKLTAVPQHFTIGFIDGDGDAFAENSKRVYSAYKDLAVTKGTPEMYQP